jgi:hypothetical protein
MRLSKWGLMQSPQYYIHQYQQELSGRCEKYDFLLNYIEL